jgi:hypothetical protein
MAVHSFVATEIPSFQVLAEKYRKQFPLGSAYVNSYDARPMLHFRPERNRRYTSLSFVKAVKRESVPPSYEELKHAYHLAGQSFVGKLKEIFLVLDDDMAKKATNSGGQSKAAKASKPPKEVKGSKRRASGDNSGELRSKVPATQ